MSFSDFLKSKTNVNWIEKYYKFDTKKFEYLLENKSENFWNVLGEQNALKLFHAASQNVPAYKDFLKNHKINNNYQFQNNNYFKAHNKNQIKKI